ncbi:MAG TPA: MFS transporter [Xanthobacteraceae bacterium]|nr:MFS transporter [Xanthobacteraceae bacterium]
MRTPASLQSRAGLDWTNFFIADVQTGFGTFVAFYLADLGWSQSNVGLVLGSGGIAGVLSLVPGGALADALPWKRALVAAGALMICGAALIFALAPTFPLVFVAEILHGSTAGIMTPAIAAISLGLVGRRAMSLRTGRNFGFSGAGTAVTAGVLGAIGSFVAPRAIFLAAAALCAPALIALSRIRPEEIDHARARNAPTGDAKLHRLIDLAKNRNLVAFAGCLMLFQFANASMLPLLGETFGATKAAHGAILISALIIGPQVVVAVMAPSVGYLSEVRGRKPVLMVGFSLEVVRAVLFAFVTNTEAVIAIELLDGVTGSIFNVMTVLIITDLTAGTGRFNLVQGVIGALLAIAAALSTGLSGFLFQGFGRAAGFLAIAAIAAGATAAAWMLLPETKPQRYADH